MCSHGGKFLPRPADGRIKYVGGETRLICVPRDITFPGTIFLNPNITETLYILTIKLGFQFFVVAVCKNSLSYQSLVLICLWNK